MTGNSGHVQAFRLALKAREAGGSRAASPGGYVHALALALGRSTIGGFAPRAVVPLAGPRAVVRALSSTAPEHAGHSPRAVVRDDVPGKGAVDQQSAGPSYRRVVAAAKVEAVQRQVVRAAERAAMRLPGPKAATAERGFAPVGRSDPALPVQEQRLPDMSVAGDPVPTMGALGQASLGVHAPTYGGPSHLAAKPPPAKTFEQEMNEYFFRLARQPLAGTTAFDPRLSPLWPGMKIPG